MYVISHSGSEEKIQGVIEAHQRKPNPKTNHDTRQSQGEIIFIFIAPSPEEEGGTDAGRHLFKTNFIFKIKEPPRVNLFARYCIFAPSIFLSPCDRGGSTRQGARPCELMKATVLKGSQTRTEDRGVGYLVMRWRSWSDKRRSKQRADAEASERIGLRRPRKRCSNACVI